MKFSLRKLFNRAPPTLSVPLSDLAEIVKPLIYDEEEASKIAFVPPPAKGEKPIEVKPKDWKDDLTLESVADGWHWAATYLQAAYSDENPKGDMYHALYASIKAVESALNNADANASSIEIKKEHLAIMKVAHINFGEASNKFEKFAGIQEHAPRPIVQLKSGHIAQISPLPFNKLPGANHAKVAKQMVAVGQNIKSIMDDLDVRPAKDAQLSGYKPYHLRHEL